MDDNRFWDLVDRFERKDISVNEVIQEICKFTKSYEVAMADLSLVVKRTITNEEKLYVKELLDAKSSKRSKRVK